MNSGAKKGDGHGSWRLWRGSVLLSMKHPRLFLVALPVLLLIAACAPPPALRDDNLLKDRSLVTNQPCAAPCFYGIVPGETSWQDALTIIEDTGNFRNLQTQTDEDGSGRVQAAWQDGENGAVCCQILSEDGQTVRLTFLRTAPLMTLGEVIGAHGEPTYLAGQEFTPDQAIISLVYPELPMVVYAFVAGPETGELSASSEIIGVLYFVQEDMDLLVQTTELHAWEGYQSYIEYVEGELEVTPSITLTPTPDQ
jgi:hypothetical protein